MKKLLITTTLLINSIIALGDYIDLPEYSHLKPFLKEEQQITFNKLMKDSQFSIDTLNGKINIAKTEKEKVELERKRNSLIKEKEKLVKNLQLNILKYPERYTENATKLKGEITNLVSTYSK